MSRKLSLTILLLNPWISRHRSLSWKPIVPSLLLGSMAHLSSTATLPLRMMVLEQMGYGFILLWSLRKRFDNAYRPLLLVTFVFSALSVLIPVILICLFSTTTISPSFLKITGEMLATILVGIVVFADTWRQSQIFFSQGFWKFAMSPYSSAQRYIVTGVLVSDQAADR